MVCLWVYKMIITENAPLIIEKHVRLKLNRFTLNTSLAVNSVALENFNTFKPSTIPMAQFNNNKYMKAFRMLELPQCILKLL